MSTSSTDLVLKQFILCSLSNLIYWNFNVLAFTAVVATHLTRHHSGVNTELTIANEMGGNIPGGNFLGRNFPGVNFPGGSSMGGNFPRGNYHGGNFPRTYIVLLILIYQLI